jgi:predicted transcriptional regulator
MARRRKSLTPLGETEMEVLRHVWRLGRATVADVRAEVLAEREIAYTTIMTVLKKLADKGYLQYEKEGRAYVYEPARRPEAVRGSLLGDLLEKVFGGSPMALVQTLVRREDLSDDERRDLQTLVESLRDHPTATAEASESPNDDGDNDD